MLSLADPYEQLRAEIVSGRLQPDERLVEADLAALGEVHRRYQLGSRPGSFLES